MSKTILLILMMTAWCAAAPESSTISPAERAIASAQSKISRAPDRCEGYNALALALARRAREISDTSFYKKADDALATSFRLSPDNFEGKKAQATILLGRHEFGDALVAAKKLNRRAPDDLMVYFLLTDANVELGNYDDAEAAAQFGLDLRPGTVPGLTRGAYLRELFGDVEGALQFMKDALDRVGRSEFEDQAWILTQAAHLESSRGRLDAADELLDLALGLFPNYHYALAERAKVRAAQGRYAEAADILARHVEAVPHAENFYVYAEMLERAGRKDEAAKAFATFESKALAESTLHDNANRDLIFYYADHANRPTEALRFAEREIAWRHDVFTLDAYAWALHVNNRNTEAKTQLTRALSIGIRDSRMLHHGDVIGVRAAQN
jgi:tetratricopeptide (TPR) repeat protein